VRKRRNPRSNPPPRARRPPPASAAAPTSVATLARTIEDDGGTALASYRDPLGGHWQILASPPIDRVEPTPFQRDPSETHVERLASAIDKLDRFLDPVIAVPAGDGNIGRLTGTTGSVP
jgi:ParB family chromosome partitioning protein